MLVDDGLLIASADGSWSAADDPCEAVRIPPSISALLSARLERLAPDERAVAERASVVGRVFEQAAVTELVDDALRPEVERNLLALVRKELVRRESTELSAGDAFKFRHILIRDAAYEALPKAERAVLHERFADWLERTVGARSARISRRSSATTSSRPIATGPSSARPAIGAGPRRPGRCAPVVGGRPGGGTRRSSIGHRSLRSRRGADPAGPPTDRVAHQPTLDPAQRGRP